MTLTHEEIRTILAEVKRRPSEELESETVEFKGYSSEKALHNDSDLPNEISALANLNGGTIIIGVRDNKNVHFGEWETQLEGFPMIDLDTAKERLQGKLLPKKYKVGLTILLFEGKYYLCISVPGKTDSLVSNANGRISIREGKSSRPAAPDEVQELVKQLSLFDWSADEVPGKISDLLNLSAAEDAKIEYCARRSLDATTVTHEAFLEAIGATRNGILTKGGLVFLGEASQINRCLGNFEFRFTWRQKNGTLRINDVWSDCLWNSINRAKEHFHTCNPQWDLEWEGTEYKLHKLDEVAFHEAYLNAIVHRDYSHSGMVSVNFTGQELSVSSPGGFYGGVTSENIVYHEPRHRNKVLANILMLFQMVDRAGVGVTRIGLSSLTYGRAFPTFEEKDGGVVVAMEAEYLRSIIFVITRDHPEFGIVDLFLLNSVYEVGHLLVSELEAKLVKLARNPWTAIEGAMANPELKRYIELRGTKHGIFVRVTDAYKDMFNVKTTLRESAAGDKHINLYKFLKNYGSGSNDEISGLLGHKYSSQTSHFLKEAEYVKKGKGSHGRWTLV